MMTRESQWRSSPLTSLETLGVLTQPWRGSGYLETVTGPASRRLISSRSGTSARIRTQTETVRRQETVTKPQVYLNWDSSLSTLSNDKFVQRQINNDKNLPRLTSFILLQSESSFSRDPRKPGVRSRYAAESRPAPGHRVPCRDPEPGRALKSLTAGSDSEQLSARCFPEQLLLLLPLPHRPGLSEPNHKHDLLHHSPGNGCHYCHSNHYLWKIGKIYRRQQITWPITLAYLVKGLVRSLGK